MRMEKSWALSMTKYPNEFLGRCAICLDNAYLSSKPCKPVWGLNGTPTCEEDCPIFRERKIYDKTLRAGEEVSKP